MPGKNGAAPDDGAEHADPTGVFGRKGAMIHLGDQDVEIRVLRIGEMKAQKAALDACPYDLTDPAGSAGQSYLDATTQLGKWDELAAWLGHWTEPPVTLEILEGAWPDEIVRLIDGIFEQSGMNWAKRALGNLREATRRRLEAAMANPAERNALLDSIPNASTSTTSSSSGSPETPQAPEPSPTPATG